MESSSTPNLSARDQSVPLRPSRKLVAAIKLSAIPAYRLCQRVGMPASKLSRLLHGAEPVKPPHDARLLQIAELLGVPVAETFEPVEAIDAERP